MAAIYEPKGAAREYSPLALNFIRGCDHGCVYCYVPKMMKRFNKNYIHSEVYTKEESVLLNEIQRSAKKFKGSEKQVFLSFTTDPYSHFNNETKLTRKVLEILLKNEIPVSILTKGGSNIFQDLDVIKQFGENIQIGMSLTFTSKEDSLKWEKNAALPSDRFESLKRLHDEGVKTWASLEPVIYPDQSLEIMDLTSEYIDGYKIGKLNHFKKHEDRFDWTKFLTNSVSIMRKNKSMFYIKKDLLKFKEEGLFLNDFETDMDFMGLKNKNNWIKEEQLQLSLNG
jgi:DNA repair photolyase